MIGGFDVSRGGAVRELLAAQRAEPASDEPLVMASPTWVDASGVVCALEGAVSGLEAIADAVGVSGRTSPETVLAAAFRRLGPDLLDRLGGSFSLVLWDTIRRRGLVVRDPVGAQPVFTTSWGGGRLFASEVVDLLRLLPRRPGPDRLALADLLSDNPRQSERTLYAGIAPLPPGHALILGADGDRPRRYWQPTYDPPATVTFADAVERFSAAARREIVGVSGSGPRGVLLSGGIDSCTVARFTVGNGAPTPRAYSMVFPEHPEIDEESLIVEVADALGLHSTRVAVQDASPLAFALRFLERWALPPASPNGYVKVPLMSAAADDGVRVVLDGEGGDELFGMSPWLIADQLWRGDFRSAARTTRRVPGAGSQPGRVLLRYAAVNALTSALPVPMMRRMRRPKRWWPPEPAPWLHPVLRAEARARENPFAWRSLDGPRWWSYLAYSAIGLREDVGHRDSLRREQVMAGVTGRHPFLDQELVELVLGLPPEIAFDPVVDRPLARESVRGAVPDAVRLRTSKSYFDPPLMRLTLRHDAAVGERLLRDPQAHLGEFLDTPAAATDLFDRGRERYRRGSEAWLADLWRLTLVEVWLRSQTDDQAPGRLAEGLPAFHAQWKRG